MLVWIVGGGVFLMAWQENSPPFSDAHDRAEGWAVAVLWSGLAFFGWQVWRLSGLTAWSRRLRVGRSLLAAWCPPFGYLYAERLLRRDLLSQLDIVRARGSGDDATI